jgi:NADH dehydrogenase
MLKNTDLPLDARGRLTCLPTLQVVDSPDESDGGRSGGRVVEGAWSAGDCAAVPDLTGPIGAYCSPSAQHAVRQAKLLADNIRRVIRGREPVPYKHKHVGSVASLGLHKGVAQVYGIKLTGFIAWLMHRTYHMSRIPSLNRKVRVVVDWTLALFLKREVVALGQLHDPREEFVEATPRVEPPSKAEGPPKAEAPPRVESRT